MFINNQKIAQKLTNHAQKLALRLQKIFFSNYFHRFSYFLLRHIDQEKNADMHH